MNPARKFVASVVRASTIVALLFLVSCGAEDHAADTASRILNRGIAADPQSLDAQRANTVEEGNVQRDLGEGLTGYTPDGQLIPAAAENWTVSEDGLTYTFNLREAARWSNGDPVTADDFVFSFQRLVTPATAAFFAQFIGDVVNARAILAGEMTPDTLGVTALDRHVLQVSLENPVPYFPELLGHPTTFPTHEGSMLEHGDQFARPGNLVTNGAYQLKEWRIGSYIELVRNTFYWNNDATSIDTVRHYVTPEPQAELNRFRAGELDITTTVPAESFAQMREERPDELRTSPARTIYYYGFNLTRPPFKGNRPLREALSLAIDREVITEKVVGRGEVPAYNFVPPGIANFESKLLPYTALSEEDRHERARELYQEAGYSADNPVEVEIRYNTSQTHRQVALTIQNMWRNVLGFEAQLINEEFQVLNENIRAAEETEVFRTAWAGDYNDAHAYLSLFETGNPSNMPRYESAEYDDLMATAATQTDVAHRASYLEEAERILLGDHAIVPLYFYVNKSMVSSRVRGWGDNVQNYHYSQHLSLEP